MSLDYRPGEPRDLPLIVGSWVDSYRTSHSAGLIPMHIWEEVMRECVAWILQRPGIEIWVAYHPKETDPRSDLYGWIVLERDYEEPVRELVNGRMQEHLAPGTCPLVHYVYVRLPYRKTGLAKGLFEAAGVDASDRWLYSCKTAASTAIVRRSCPHARFAPLIARHTKNQPRSTQDESAGDSDRSRAL